MYSFKIKSNIFFDYSEKMLFLHEKLIKKLSICTNIPLDLSREIVLIIQFFFLYKLSKVFFLLFLRVSFSHTHNFCKKMLIFVGFYPIYFLNFSRCCGTRDGFDKGFGWVFLIFAGDHRKIPFDLPESAIKIWSTIRSSSSPHSPTQNQLPSSPTSSQKHSTVRPPIKTDFHYKISLLSFLPSPFRFRNFWRVDFDLLDFVRFMLIVLFNLLIGFLFWEIRIMVWKIN